MSAEKFFIVVLICLVGLIVLIALSVLAIIKTNKYREVVHMPKQHVSCAQNLLEQIGIKSLPSEKAGIFLQLMMTGYVLIHKQINEGNKYNDYKQTERFKRSLTNDVIQSLNSIEGKDIC